MSNYQEMAKMIKEDSKFWKKEARLLASALDAFGEYANICMSKKEAFKLIAAIEVLRRFARRKNLKMSKSFERIFLHLAKGVN